PVILNLAMLAETILDQEFNMFIILEDQFLNTLRIQPEAESTVEVVVIIF
ncbi:uncharacterized protein BO96DRAFT_351373, partial [Aspergillus niger CBS 101883]